MIERSELPYDQKVHRLALVVIATYLDEEALAEHPRNYLEMAAWARELAREGLT